MRKLSFGGALRIARFDVPTSRGHDHLSTLRLLLRNRCSHEYPLSPLQECRARPSFGKEHEWLWGYRL